MTTNRLIVIGGATATGKTALSVRLAQHLGAEILSADSRQFYREMRIGTAKPIAAELAAVPHHFIDMLSVSDDYSVGDFERDALVLLEKLFSNNKYAVMVGGSGLYVRAVCEGLDRFPPVSQQTRDQVSEGEKTGGLAWLQRELALLDPQYFAQVDINNPARIRRALEVCVETGRPYSHFLGQGSKAARPFLPVYILLELPRPLLYERINARVDAMVAAGLEEEARALYPFRARPALKTVGYVEFFDFFDGKMSRQQAIDKIKQHSRNYAKRQITWFAKYGHWRKINPLVPNIVTQLAGQISEMP